MGLCIIMDHWRPQFKIIISFNFWRQIILESLTLHYMHKIWKLFYVHFLIGDIWHLILDIFLKHIKKLLLINIIVIHFLFLKFIPNPINSQFVNFIINQKHLLTCLVSGIISLPVLPHHRIWNILVIIVILFNRNSIKKNSAFLIRVTTTLGVIVQILFFKFEFVPWWCGKNPYRRYRRGICKSLNGSYRWKSRGGSLWAASE